LAISILSLNLLFGDITGIVFRDLPFNGSSLANYGSRETKEPGVQGVTVTGFDENGNFLSVITDENGSYTLKGLSGKVRVEFSNWPDYLRESSYGDNNNSSVIFTQDGNTEVNFGIYHNPKLDFYWLLGLIPKNFI